MPFGLAGVEDRDDVRVVELGRAARLAHEALAELLVRRERRGEQLQRHLASEPHVLGQVDDAHAAAPEQAGDLVTDELAADREIPAGRRCHAPGSFPSTVRG